MTQPVLSLTEKQTFTALRSFLLAILPGGIEVVRGLDNRVAEPEGVDFVTMTPIMRERLELNVTTYIDGAFLTPPVAGNRIDLQPTKVTIQLDVHGPASSDNVQIISTLFRSGYASEYFAGLAVDVWPLYASEPRQMPFHNGEQQVEERWSIDAVLQANATVTTPQDFADQLVANIKEVGAEYPIN
jgi:hypothetical protein